MSIVLMTQAWASTMSSGKKFVLLSLCDNANEQGMCYPSVGLIAQKCTMGERTVQQHLRALEEEGIIRREMRAGRRTWYFIHPEQFPQTPADNAPPQYPHPADDDVIPPQDLPKTPAKLAPRTVKEPSQKRQVVRAARLPSDWVLPKAWGEWAMQHCPEWTVEQVRQIGEKFKDHWIALSGQRANKTDWLATWRNWCRNESARQPAAGGAKQGGGMWWASDTSILAKGAELNLRPYPGEAMPAFKGRVQAAIDNGGVAPAPKPSVLPPLPVPTAPASSDGKRVKPEGLDLKSLISKNYKRINNN